MRAFPLGAQQPAPPAAEGVPAYRAPTIALVQPAPGGTVPNDRPVVVFRFGAGEPADPIDARSFAVAVSDHDRTSFFHVTATEAWGPLADDAQPLAPGPHQVTARICSTRGACGTVTATVIAVSDPAAAASRRDAAPPATSRRARLVELVLDAARRLLTP